MAITLPGPANLTNPSVVCRDDRRSLLDVFCRGSWCDNQPSSPINDFERHWEGRTVHPAAGGAPIFYVGPSAYSVSDDLSCRSDDCDQTSDCNLTDHLCVSGESWCENHELVKEIQSLHDVKDDWKKFGIDPINEHSIAVAIDFVRSIDTPLLVRPKVVPMTKGRFQLEWHRGPRSLEIEFETPSLAHYLKWDSSSKIQEEDVILTSKRECLLDLIAWFDSGIENG